MPPTTANDETNQSVRVDLIDVVQFVMTHKFFLQYFPPFTNKEGYSFKFHAILLKFPTGSARCTGMSKYEVCVEAFENIMLEEPPQSDNLRITSLDFHRRTRLELFKNKRRYWIEIDQSALLSDRLKTLNIATASLRLAAKRDTDAITAVTKRLTQGLK